MRYTLRQLDNLHAAAGIWDLWYASDRRKEIVFEDLKSRQLVPTFEIESMETMIEETRMGIRSIQHMIDTDAKILKERVMEGQQVTLEEANRIIQQGIAETYLEKGARLVRSQVNKHLDKSDPPVQFDVYPVWFCKTLQNWKALYSTTLNDQRYYEVTYNGDKKETYIDVYQKWDNVCVSDEE